MFTCSQKGNLIRILKDYKIYQANLPACFRDDDVIEEILKVLNEEKV